MENVYRGTKAKTRTTKGHGLQKYPFKIEKEIILRNQNKASLTKYDSSLPSLSCREIWFVVHGSMKGLD